MKIFIAIILIIMSVGMGFKHIPMTYHFNVVELTRDNTLYDIYYKVLIYVLDRADSNDTVVLDIDSAGGVVISGIAIINSMLTTRAYTVAHIRSGAVSMGAMIATAADKIMADEYSYFLFHRPRTYNIIGKFTIVEDIPLDKYFDDNVAKYLSEEELESYNYGEDVEIYGPEFAKRANRGIK